MKLFRIIIVIFLLVALAASRMLPHAHAQTKPIPDPNDTVTKVVTDKANDIVDKTFFNNVASLAGPTCSMYGLGIDIVNFFYDGEWNFRDSVLEVTALFRNSSWRELIWAINDQREAYTKVLTTLNKQKCVLEFALPQQNVKDQKAAKSTNDQIAKLDRRITQVQAERDYFGIQRRNMIFDQPHFPDPTDFDPKQYAFSKELPTDKIFYSLYSSDNFKVNGDEFARDSKQFLKSAAQDVSVVSDDLPDTCFAAVHIGHELELYFAYAFRFDGGQYKDSQGRVYASFADFVAHNRAAIAKSYNDTYCQKSSPKNFQNPVPETGADEEFRIFQQKLGEIIKQVGSALADLNKQLVVFDTKRANTPLTPDEQTQLTALEQQTGKYQGMIDFYTLTLNKVGSSGAKSLSALAKHLQSFVDAIANVTRDQNGNTSSKLSFSEQFEKQKEKQLQQICSRIETMYRKSGRDTGQLPVIGMANGTTYCRANPDCADVNLSNVFGGSEGLKKLAECSGFLFDGSELGPNQATKDIIKSVGQDIGYLLEQNSFNDLLKAQKLHYTSLRSQYQELYKTQGDTTAILDNILTDVSSNLYNSGAHPNVAPGVPPVFDPGKPQAKTQYSLLRKIYQDFWKFMDQQQGSCSAPETPEE